MVISLYQDLVVVKMNTRAKSLVKQNIERENQVEEIISQDLDNFPYRRQSVKKLRELKKLNKSRSISYGIRKSRVNIQREENDKTEMQRKFLLLHRREISKKINNILLNKTRSLSEYKCQIKWLVSTVVLIKIANITLDKYNVSFAI